jgi:hypothetical protein
MDSDIYHSKSVIEEFMKERGIAGTLLFSSIAGDVEYNLEVDGDPREYQKGDEKGGEGKGEEGERKRGRGGEGRGREKRGGERKGEGHC